MIRALGANLIGRVWVAALQLVFFPFVHSQLDADSFGLVGLYLLWLPLLAVMDFGFGLSVTRHLAQHNKDREFSGTVEMAYWASSLAMLVVGSATAYLLSPLWVHPGSLSVDTVRLASCLVAASFALQWPNAYYSGALFGLNRHGSYNLINSLFWSIRCAVGAYIVWSKHDAVMFLGWQALIVMLQNLAFSLALWRSLPAKTESSQPTDRAATLKKFLREARPTGSALFLIMLYNQVDKIIASRLLSLSEMGIYGLAWQLVSGMYLLQSPIYSSYSARLSVGLAQRNTPNAIHPPQSCELSADFQRSCMLMMTLAAPVALTGVVFGTPLLQLWTGDAALAQQNAGLIKLLFAGAFFSCVSYMPLTLQQIAGHSQVIARSYIPAGLVSAIACWQLFPTLGALAGGVISAGLNLVMTPGLVYGASPLVKTSWPRWWMTTVLLPSLACLAWLGILSLFSASLPPILLLGLASLGAIAAASACQPRLWGSL